MADPNQLVTLTLVGTESSVIRARISRLRHDLAGRGYPGEYWGAIERNPKLTGHHVHLWRRGRYLPQGLLSERAQAWGMGRVVDIRRYSGGPKGVVYGVKGSRGTSYGLKAGLADGGLDGFLDLHGGRYGLWSRDFFGKPYREALREALTRPDRHGHDPGPWRVVNVADMYQQRWERRRHESG